MTLKTFVAAIAIAVALPSYAAAARPALRDVPEIENALFAVAIADAVRDNCSSINARLVRALSFLRQIKAQANALGYSDDEIRNYVESDVEKARMRKKGKAFLAANGVNPDDPETFCTFGRAEIAKNSAIGALLRAN
ncbi:DUF5333 domain-containing protein [Seohaeicola nanhaiensis]|uniref:DUF5333 domain-containing protein n=1 Tax=Seohaeicola nanhaiensis TaxID=1387282 RepID=A0ABV9KEK1_9RHOB